MSTTRGFTATLLLLVGTALSTPAPARQAVAADFEHGRIFVQLHSSGRTLRLFTDTGGGWNAISARAAADLGLQPEEVTVSDGELRLVAFPPPDASHPFPVPGPQFMQGRLHVVTTQELEADGTLGGRWFADRIWDIDYPRQTLHRLEPGEFVPPVRAARLPLGFQTTSKGERSTHFPSIEVQIDGEQLPMLLDTGATATAGPDAAAEFGVSPGTRVAASFIEFEVFERWRQRHPDWRVLQAGDALTDPARRMIEVPALHIGGLRVGPVWFAERPRGTFQSWLSSMMDRPVWGALGGSALQSLRIVIDYPQAMAYLMAD